MTYVKVMKRASQGYRVWRKAWNEWYYVTSNGGELTMHDPLNGAPEMTRQWKYTPSEADLVATDWRVAGKVRMWR